MKPCVVFVDETAAIGGAELNLLLKAQHLPAYGWATTVVLPAHGPFFTRLRQHNIAVDVVPHRSFFSTSFYLGRRLKLPNPLALLASLLVGLLWSARLWRNFRQTRPAVIHTVSMWAHAFAGLAGKLAGIPVVWHFQDIVQPRAGFGLYHRLVGLAARFIPHKIISISTAVAAQFEQQPALQAKIKLLPNAIDINRFPGRANGQNGAAPGRPLTIGYVARLTPWKGQEVALQTARQLKAAGVACRWLFAGDEALGVSGYRRHLQQLAGQWQLDDQVEFVGWVDDMPAFYHSLDLLVHLPTAPEPYGLALAEALAAGLPVITTPDTGLGQGITAAGGMIVAPNRPQAAAEAIAMFAASPPLLTQRSRQARQFAEQHFSVAYYMTELTQLYQSLSKDV